MKGTEARKILRGQTSLPLFQPPADLLCRLMSESQYDHPAEPNIFHIAQIQQLRHQHRGLAASHIGIDHAGMAVIQHRLSLLRIQLPQYLFFHPV